MGDTLYIDFETRSAEDIKPAGVHRYAQHPTTDALCLAIAFNDEKSEVVPSIWLTGFIPERVTEHIKAGKRVVAHNATFELAIWNLLCVEKYGWVPLPPEIVSCTMARAYAMGLPGQLDAAAAAMGIEQRKDQKGHRLMLKMSRPKKYDPHLDVLEWHEADGDLSLLYEYSAQDVVVERELDKRLLKLSASEQKLWLIDHEINNRGVAVDTLSAITAVDIVKSEEERLNSAIREVTDNFVATYNSNVALKNWLNHQGVPATGVAKNEVITLLAKTDLPQHCRRALEVRQEAAKSSTKKLQAILNGACLDGRIRGILQYYAAHTGRWGGRRLQPQNFPRPMLLKQPQIEEVMSMLQERSDVDNLIAEIDLLYGPVMTVLSECLRAFITAGKGQDLFAADFSSIEARVLAWLADDEPSLHVFRTHGKAYEAAAAEIHGVDISTISKEDFRRQLGKIAVLSLGFEGGVGAFQSMARNHGVSIAPVAKILWAKATHEHRSRAMDRWESTGKKTGIDKAEWIGSELIKLAWRAAHPAIVQYWGKVNAAAIAAVKSPGFISSVDDKVRFVMRGSFLFCQPPSGRCLCYPYPKVELKPTPWGQKREMLTYKYVDSVINKWVRGATYGGSIVENIVQAVARDILAEAIVRVEERTAWNVVLHVHDEIVAEADSTLGPSALEVFESAVQETPPWARGLPISAKGWRGKRYRK